MGFNTVTKKTEYAQCLIERYQKEVGHDHRYTGHFRDDRDFQMEKTRPLYCFPALYSALFYDPSPEHIRYIGDEGYHILQFKDAFFVARVMRRASIEIGSVDFDAWAKYCTVHPNYYNCNRILLICGAVHPNGYLREQCVKRFAGIPLTLEYVLLLLNDPVPAVRKAAQEQLAEQMQRTHAAYEFISAMPFVDYVRRGERAHRDAGFSMDALDTALMRFFEEQEATVRCAHQNIRKLCYEVYALHPEPKYRGLILNFYQHEKNGALRFMLERTYLQMTDAALPEKTLALFTGDRYEKIRLTAYKHRLQHEGVWDGLAELLVSSSYQIRRFAGDTLENNGFDCYSYAQTHLPDTLLALSDFKNPADIPPIRSYMETHPREALTGLVRIGSADTKALLWRYLHADDQRLAKTAFRLAEWKRCFEKDELLAAIPDEPDSLLRMRLMYLLTKDGVWEVMPELIRFYKDDPQNRRSIEYLIRHSLFRPVPLPDEMHEAVTKALAYARGVIPTSINNQIFTDMQWIR